MSVTQRRFSVVGRQIALLIVSCLFINPAFGQGSIELTSSLRATVSYTDGNNGSEIADPPGFDEKFNVAAGDELAIFTNLDWSHSSNAGEGDVAVSGTAEATLKLDENRKPSGYATFSGHVVVNARPNEDSGFENITAQVFLDVGQSWSGLGTAGGVFYLDSRITSVGGGEQWDSDGLGYNWQPTVNVTATNHSGPQTKVEQVSYFNLWRAADSTFPGASESNALGPHGGAFRPGNGAVTSGVGGNDVPPAAQIPTGISGIRLTALSGSSQLAASMAGEESTYAMSSYGNPVVTGGFGDTEVVYHQGSTDQELALKYTSGYLFMNNGGGNFTSFTIPDALPGGDSQFRINWNGVGHDLSVGDVFDFTTLDPAGVDTFVLAEIDETEQISPQVDMPFTIGVTTAAGSDANFVAVPLIPVTPGDFTLDHRIDGADFLAWQRGDSPDALSSDDLLDWQTNYSFDANAPPAALSAIPVPEPSSWALLVFGCLVARLRRS